MLQSLFRRLGDFTVVPAAAAAAADALSEAVLL